MKRYLRKGSTLWGVLYMGLFFLCVTTIAKAENIALFYNDTYVQISQGNLFAEGSNLLLSLQEQGHNVQTFSSLDEGIWGDMINQNDLIVVPELERKNLFADLSEATIHRLKNYVYSGGGLIICGVVAPNVANANNAIALLNGVFDFHLAAENIALSGASNKVLTQSSDTHFATCLDVISNNNSIAFLTSGLPAGTKTIYKDAADQHNTTVAMLPYGNGEIAYLGWGWWNAAPLGSQDDGWMDVLHASVKEVACKTPVAKAKSVYTLTLTEEQTSLDAAALDAGSVYCGTANFRVAPSTFTCDHLGSQEVLFTIEDGSGRTSSQLVTIEVTDPHNVCQAIPSTASISGTIQTHYGKEMADVTLEAIGLTLWTNTTNNAGSFVFENMPTLAAYAVSPRKNNDPLNGVSTYDLMLISQHILGVQTFEHPEQIIAADVNADGFVSTADVVELRDLILYRISHFTANESWTFVPSNYVFQDPTNPLEEAFPEQLSINNLEQDMQVGFKGIKTGDVDGSAVTNIGASSGNRTANAPIALRAVHSHNTIRVYATNTNVLSGMQLALSFEGADMAGITVTSDVFEAGGFATAIDTEKGIVFISAFQKESLHLSSEMPLFEIQADFNIKKISLHTRFMQPEVYTQNGIHNIQLAQEATTEGITESIYQEALRLDQNYPNPFDTYTLIPFHIEQAGRVILEVHNAQGQLVYTTQGYENAGSGTYQLVAEDIPGSGFFTYTISTNGKSKSRTMIKTN